MIGCDHCEEWYHGDCVKVTEREAKYIKRYYCKMCRQKNSKLETVYKSAYKDRKEDKETRYIILDFMGYRLFVRNPSHSLQRKCGTRQFWRFENKF